jgi:hypothetical protein
MAATAAVSAWLGRVRHDLVKRVVWPARDRRDMGGASEAGELLPRLVDEEGRPVTPVALWKVLAAEAPEIAEAQALDTFAAALESAQSAAAAGDVGGVIALEAAFETLTRGLERRSQGER